MATNLAIDDKLLEEARLISGLKTKKETVNSALREFVDRRKQLEPVELFGKLNSGPSYNCKTLAYQIISIIHISGSVLINRIIRVDPLSRRTSAVINISLPVPGCRRKENTNAQGR